MTIRRFLTTLVLAALCCAAGAQEGYFNSTAGKTLKWVIYDGSGSLFGHCHETLVSMSGDRDDARIRFSYMFYDAKGKSVTGSKPFEFDVTIEKGTARAYIRNVAKAAQSGDYMPVGDISSIPGSIAVGDRLRDTEIQVRVLNVFTATNAYRNRRVSARETVSVPAGTFDCFLIEDDEYFTGSGPFRVKTWVAKGVGIVRQVIYKKDGSVNQTLELVN
jgi:hypothetical protein